MTSDNTALMLRTCHPDGTSHRRFVWPAEGRVTAPDWDPAPRCGGGLHGLLDGQGDGALLDWSDDALWQVCTVDRTTAVDLGGKVKVPAATVVYTGDRAGALDVLRQAGVSGPLPGDTVTVGDGGTATAGNRGTAVAGNRGTAVAGDRGTATVGDGGTATVGYRGTAVAGDRGTAVVGYGGTATVGDGGTATAGNWGTATAGDEGTATAGDWGTATVGDGGTATAGDRGIVSVGWRDGNRRRVTVGYVGYVGEDGIQADVPYKATSTGELVPAEVTS